MWNHAKHGLKAFVALSTAVALATGVVACSSRSGGTTATPAAGSTAATPTPTPTEFSGDLRTLLLPMPAAATPTKGPNNTDGLIDADQEAAAIGSTAARIKTAGFHQGAIGEWVESDGTWIGIFLTQCNDPASATTWAQSTRDSFESDNGFGAGVPIPGVFNGKVYARTSISVNGRWLTEAAFSKNAISVELFVTGAVKHDPQKTIDLAVAQYARLP